MYIGAIANNPLSVYFDRSELAGAVQLGVGFAPITIIDN